MKRNFFRNSLSSWGFLATFVLGLVGTCPSVFALPTMLYEYSFLTDGTNTGTSSGGNLTVSNGASGGVKYSNGVLDARTGQTYNSATSSGMASGTLSLGTKSAITIALWINPSVLGTGTDNYARIFNLGSTSTYDGSTTTGGVSLALNGSKQFMISVNGTNANSTTIGPTLSTNTWFFVAITYDGSVSNPYGTSSVQLAATGDDSHNGQLYVGGVSSSVTNYGFSVTDGVSPNYYGLTSINFGAITYLYLANRSTGDRAFNGMIDNFQIYDGVLTESELDNLRLTTLPIPETDSVVLLLIGIAAFGLLALRKNSPISSCHEGTL